MPEEEEFASSTIHKICIRIVHVQVVKNVAITSACHSSRGKGSLPKHLGAMLHSPPLYRVPCRPAMDCMASCLKLARGDPRGPVTPLMNLKLTTDLMVNFGLSAQRAPDTACVNNATMA